MSILNDVYNLNHMQNISAQSLGFLIFLKIQIHCLFEKEKLGQSSRICQL